ncbi:hypothetical protein [Deinococcus sp. JMULE3]|uniref:hypothetical protein n=1 Tax=Deinococcus sp. JMULE3 TaxID=2518341 RepID=UPI0015769062|nr:hypothetical protein [Deinococcus sp. JMULE3]NTY01878.1 hypothetical protein [Deinococcus sp. JMULE3]
MLGTGLLDRVTRRHLLLLAALLGTPLAQAQALAGPEDVVMAVLTGGEGVTALNTTHEFACGVLERAGWTLSRAGVDGQGRAVRVYRDGSGRHSALVWDLKPVQVRVTDGDMSPLRSWTLLEE